MKLINQVQLSEAELQVCPKFTELIEQLEKVCFSENSPLVLKDAAENVAQVCYVLTLFIADQQSGVKAPCTPH